MLARDMKTLFGRLERPRLGARTDAAAAAAGRGRSRSTQARVASPVKLEGQGSALASDKASSSSSTTVKAQVAGAIEALAQQQQNGERGSLEAGAASFVMWADVLPTSKCTPVTSYTRASPCCTHLLQ